MKSKDSYIVAIIPPKKIAVVVDKYRNKYSLYSSYKIVPHVTISPPFYLEKISEKQITNLLKERLSALKSVNLSFDNIDYFPNGGDKNVAFFAPNKNSISSIKTIFDVVNKVLKGRVTAVYDNYNFNGLKNNPHMTIASKIPDDKFESIKKELNLVKENFTFKVNHIYLYKKKYGTNEWIEIEKVKLGS